MSAPLTSRTISMLPLAGLIVIIATLPGLGQADKPSAAPGVAPPVPTLTIPAGERLVLELETPLHTRATKKNDIVEFVTHRDLVVGRRVVVPKGTRVRATVTKSKRPGRIKGKGEIHLQFDEIELPDGTRLPLSVHLLRAGFIEVKGGKVQEPKAEGDGGTARDVMVIAQGGLQGVLLGGALGGRKGAGYGGAVGAGIGLLGMLLRRGPELDLPRGTLFEVELNEEMAVPVAATSQLAARQKPVFPAEDDAGNFHFPDLMEEEAEPAPKFEDTEARTEQPPTESTAPSDKSAPPAAALPPAPEWKGPHPSAGSYTFKVDVALVTMETVVRDPAGRAMDKLKKDDFRVLEDGVEQDIRHFSRDEFPLAVALVVDRSGSVAPFMRELRNAAYQTLSQLKRGDQVALFSFAGETRLLEGLTTDRQRVANRIDRIRPGGGTNIIDALFEASDYLARAAPNRRRAIILISDNQHTMRASNSERTLLRYLLESETVVYSVKTQGEGSMGLLIPTIQFGGNLVKGITKETGGEVIKVRGRGSLARALEIVISRLKLRYTLGYVSANKSRDGRFRRVEIRLSDRFGEYGRNYSTLHRRGYYALTASAAAQNEP